MAKRKKKAREQYEAAMRAEREAWGEWNIEENGPMTLERAVEELRFLYIEDDDPQTPHLLSERVANGWNLWYKDGLRVQVRMTVARG